jgi:hypothetical protein
VVFVLNQVGHRMTGEEIADEMDARNLIHSRKNLFDVLSRMVKTGLLDNRKAVRPRGYGLVAWEGRDYADPTAHAGGTAPETPRVA